MTPKRYTYPPDPQWPTQALPDLVAVVTMPGMAPLDARPEPWPSGFGFDGGEPTLAAYRRDDVPADIATARVGVFGLTAAGEPSQAIASFQIVLECAEPERVARELGLTLVGILSGGTDMALVEPGASWKDAGLPFDIVLRMLAHPEVAVAEPLLWQRLVGRG